jgi:hypothetical protein
MHACWSRLLPKMNQKRFIYKSYFNVATEPLRRIANVEQSASPLAASHWQETMFSLPLCLPHMATLCRELEKVLSLRV